jgi:2-amino-4-hydroxy-6-hydroxymethyldihydropteridine diphosphokinase
VAHCLIGLGSNLGDRRATIEASIRLLEAHPDVRVVAVSRLHETRAVGGPPGEQPAFLNAAARVETALSPEQLLEVLQQSEERLGRVRERRWDARTVDLDLLLYGDLIRETSQLVLPHPRMAFRRFALEPAIEIAADMIHPTTGWNLEQVLHHLKTVPAYVALVGLPGAGKTRLARKVAQRTGGYLVTASLSVSGMAAFHADPSGRAWETQLEFLRSRGRRLSRCSPKLLGDRFAISDFWLDQTLVYSHYWLPAVVWQDFERHWSEVKARSLRPKLLVFVDAAESSTGVFRGDDEAGAARERLRAALLRQASLPRQAPLLRVNTSDFAWAAKEVAAALQAMQDSAA